MVGVLAWVRWLMCLRGWRIAVNMLVNSVGDIGGTIDGEQGSIVGGALFLKRFPKTSRK